MKKIGLIGGLTWVSTLDYYRLLNQMVNEKLGGSEAAEIIMFSVNFGAIKKLTEAGDWQGISNIIIHAAKTLEAAGAACIMVGANTMHKIADEIQAAIKIPLIHIATETAKAINEKGLHKVALLGTRYTMQLNFYKNKLAAHGIAVIIPGEDDIAYINEAIYNEMGKGIFLPATKQKFITIINNLQQLGAQGAILGCTEIPILIKQEDIGIIAFDTTYIHTSAAIKFVLQ
jgi:aspartate racemase